MLKNVSEAEGLDGWVAAKITKAADYLGPVTRLLQMKYEEASICEGKKKDLDGDGDIDPDDYMKAKDKVQKAMNKKDESCLLHTKKH